jgi:hypothetical protein
MADLTLSPGWKEATSEQRAQIRAYAFQYLADAPPEGIEWIGKNTVYRPVTSGYRALRLLYNQDRQRLNSLPAKLWADWVGAILWFPSNDGTTERTIRAEIAKIARERAPENFIAALRTLLTHPDSNFETAEIVALAFDEEVGGTIYNALQNNQLNYHAATRLFKLLIDQQFDQASQMAVAFLTTTRQNRSVAPNLEAADVYAPALWFLAHPKEAWPLLWQLRSTDPLLLKAIWEWIGSSSWGELYVEALQPERVN